MRNRASFLDSIVFMRRITGEWGLPGKERSVHMDTAALILLSMTM